jgi:polyphosphate kinase
LKHLLLAPVELRNALVHRVRREAEPARAGLPAKIVLRMNSLVDPTLIDELYSAGRAGVAIALIVRGICCLRWPPRDLACVRGLDATKPRPPNRDCISDLGATAAGRGA